MTEIDRVSCFTYFLSACCPGPTATEQTLTLFSIGLSHFSTSVKDFLLGREFGFGLAMSGVQRVQKRTLFFAMSI